MNITKKHLGKRLLIRHKYHYAYNYVEYIPIIEVKLLEISNSGKSKFRYLSGNISWEDTEDYEVLDILPDDTPF